MAIPGLKDGFCDVAYADTLLGSISPWVSTPAGSKEDSLQWARVYIEENYSCDDFLATTFPEYLQTANALFANEHLTSSLFVAATGSQPQNGLKSTRVKAGDVESEKEFDTTRANHWVDPYPQISAILTTNGCVLKKGGFKTIPLLRR